MAKINDSSINLAYRHLLIGDDEPSRLNDNKAQWLGWLKDDGLSDDDIAKLDKLIDKSDYGEMAKIIGPYISHKPLYLLAQGLWLELIFIDDIGEALDNYIDDGDEPLIAYSAADSHLSNIIELEPRGDDKSYYQAIAKEINKRLAP